MMTSEAQEHPTGRQLLTTEGTTMRAIVQDRYGEAGDVLRLEEIDRPAIGDDEVLLRSPRPSAPR
jgi:hypothetical protein